MRRWYMLLDIHNHVIHDEAWPLELRIDVCRLLQRKMLELGDLRPIPFTAENTIGLILEKSVGAK